MEKREITSRNDLIFVLDHFYDRVKIDPLIGPIFVEQAQVHWETHLPKIYDFWDSLLFGKDVYHGRPFPPHVPLGLKAEHFKRWLELFFQTLDEFSHGQKADEMKIRAYNIGQNFLSRIQMMEQN